MFFKWTGRGTGSDNLFAEAGSVRPSIAPPPYQLLVHRQGVGREEGRLWGDFWGKEAASFVCRARRQREEKVACLGIFFLNRRIQEVSAGGGFSSTRHN